MKLLNAIRRLLGKKPPVRRDMVNSIVDEIERNSRAHEDTLVQELEAQAVEISEPERD